jgi:hypothetical protein
MRLGNFLWDFRKKGVNTELKIRPAETELFHMNGRTDGQTDMTDLILTYRNFENKPKNHLITLHNHIESDKKMYLLSLELTYYIIKAWYDAYWQQLQLQ